MSKRCINEWKSITEYRKQKQLFCITFVEYRLASGSGDAKMVQRCEKLMQKLISFWNLPSERVWVWKIECIASMHATCVALRTSQLRMHF